MALTYLVFIVVVTVALSIASFGVAEDWIDSRILEMDLEQVVQATLGLDELQAKLDRLQHERDPLDAEMDLEYLKSNLTVRFDRVSTSVRDLKTTIQQLYGSFITTEPDDYPRCCEVTSGVTNWDFKTEILDDKFCYYKSDQSREGSLYPNVESSLQIITAMRNNHYDSTSDSSIRWQFFGSIDGISLKFPAAADNDACGSFDNRVRPWYVEGATSRYRDNIIVIEITEAMTEPFELMRRVARNVLESLNPNDRIGLVFFNQGAHTPTGDDQSSKCYYSELAYATPQNREYLNNSLNDENLDPLEGSARYVEGISAAFQLFDQTPQIDGQSRDKVIMLFTAASSNVFNPQSVYDHTENLNNEMNDEVTIFTYAFGEEISPSQQQFLETLANQTWSNSPTIKRGDFTHINSSRRYDPGTYYKFASRDSSDITPIFTVPYYDSWGLGMVVSTCLPVHYEDELVGVTCIDLVLADLLGTIDSFVHGEHSYAFVIDATGRTLVHPLLPQIHTVTEDPIILNIRVLERSADDQDDVDFILSEMKSGGSGSRTVSTAKIYSLGDSMLHGFEEQQFRSHYHWNAISGHSFSVCLVVVDSDVNLQIDSLSPEDIGSMKFLYHRTDFQQGDERLGETFTYCNDNGQVAVKGRSVVQLAGAAFTDPNFFYNKPTTRNRISKLRNYILGEDLQGERDGKSIYRPNVRALIQHTTSMDDIWSRKSVYEDFVKLRILSFNNGVTRTFPGSSVNNYFNDKTRPWHRVATAYPGEVTVAAPYPDVLGEDIVITIAQTIYAPKSSGQHSSNDLILGVTAVDLKVGFLYTLVKKYDACLESNQRCLIIDSSGYVVYHDDFLNVDESSTADRHIVDMEPALASYFIQSGYMVKTTCADFVNVQDAHSWKMSITNLRHFDVGPNVPDFEIQKVGNSNVFLLIIREKSTPESCSCTESTSLPICNDDVTCECPCYAVYDDDEYHYCKNSFVLQSYVDTHTCIPQVNQLPKSIDDPLQVNISTLEACHVVMCAAYTSEKECGIFSANGCSWCTTSDSETKRCLEASLCAEYLPSNDSGLSGGAIAGIVIGLLVLLIVLAAVILFILYRRGIILSGRQDGKSTRTTSAPTDQTYGEYEDPPVVQYDYADKSYLESQINHQMQPTAQVPPPLPSREDDSVQGSGYALQTAPDHHHPSGNANAGFQDSGNHSGGSILHEGTPPSGGCNNPNRGGLYITSPAQAASDDTQVSDVPHKVAENQQPSAPDPTPSAPDSNYETPTDHSNTSSTMELDKQRSNYVNKSMSDTDSYGLERTSDIVITEN